MAGRKSREQIAAEEAKREDEINARVDERVKALFEDLKAQMSADKGAGAIPSVSNGDAGTAQILSDLVVNMQKMMNPQDRKRVFSPEELRQMEEARTEMVRLLIEAQEKGEMPVYALTQKIYVAEQLIEPQYLDQRTQKMMVQEINWPRIPNESMVPVNDVAKAIHEQFMISLMGVKINQNTAPAFVLAGKEVRRMAPTDTAHTGQAPMEDPRAHMSGVEPVDYDKPMNVLGTVAAPVTPTQGARFENGQPSVRE